jgi:hypothetical protein
MHVWSNMHCLINFINIQESVICVQICAANMHNTEKFDFADCITSRTMIFTYSGVRRICNRGEGADDRGPKARVEARSAEGVGSGAMPPENSYEILCTLVHLAKANQVNITS